MNWLKNIEGKLKKQESLKNKTTFRVGGEAEFFIEPRDAEDLKYIVRQAKVNKIPLSVLGAGSNVLLADKGIRGIVLRLSAPYFRKISFKGNIIKAGSGVMLGKLAQKASARGLSGMESLCGIPGTLGGAVLMNAGAFGKEIAEIVENISVMDYNGFIKIISGKDAKFKYRGSGLSRYIILGASLRLSKINKKEIMEKLRFYRSERLLHQDYSNPSAGCVFKNPSGRSAGMLIDACGLKGKTIGGAYVSESHANFILNRKNAKASDILKLIKIIKDKVRKRFGITLEPEIKIWL